MTVVNFSATVIFIKLRGSLEAAYFVSCKLALPNFCLHLITRAPNQQWLSTVQTCAEPLLWQHSMESAMEVVRCNSAILGAPSAAMLSGGTSSSGGRTDLHTRVSRCHGLSACEPVLPECTLCHPAVPRSICRRLLRVVARRKRTEDSLIETTPARSSCARRDE